MKAIDVLFSVAVVVQSFVALVRPLLVFSIFVSIVGAIISLCMGNFQNCGRLALVAVAIFAVNVVPSLIIGSRFKRMMHEP